MAKIPNVDRRLARAQTQEHRSSLEQLRIRRAIIEGRTVELRRDLNVLIRECQQLVASILRLRARDGTSDLRHMEASRLRVAAVGSVFLQRDINGPNDLVDFGTALRQVSHEVDDQFGRRNVGLRCDISPVPVTVRRGQHLALIANELVSNAYEHAFVGRPFGAIEVGTRLVQAQRGVLWVLDNGIGCPSVRSPSGAGGGWTIINALARSLEAELTYTDMRPGTRVDLAFKAT